MQLGLRKKLTLATCSLLGVASMAVADVEESTVLDNQPADNQEDSLENYNTEDVPQNELFDWKFSAGLLYYSETDRVTAIEPVVKAQKNYDTDTSLSLKFTFDTLTGASPNGASASADAQTFTGSSGSTGITAAAGETPLDPAFKDTRYAFNVQYETPLSSNWKSSIGGNVSFEQDFKSYAANGGLSYDFNNKNTTLSFGASVEYDTINPLGGVPVPLSSINDTATGDDDDDENEGVECDENPTCQSDTDDRLVIDALVGLTQIINKRSLVQLNYSLGISDGYMNDPYKIVSIVEGSAGSNLGDTNDYLYESRPDTRLRHALYTLGKYKVGSEDVVDLGYRYYWDDWGITSHTIDFHYRWYFLNAKSYLEPHIRYYIQNPADFFVHSLPDTTTTPDFLSADYRLGRFDAVTLGLKYGQKTQSGDNWSARLEYYLQDVKDHPDSGIGSQMGVDLSPSVSAIMTQFIYNWK